MESLMKKYHYILLTLLYATSVFSAGQYTIDPKTSQAIPNFAGKAMMVRGEINKLITKPDSTDVYTKRINVGTIIKENDTITAGPK